MNLLQVCQHRNLINNFCTAQNTKLQQLSSETTKFIETSRSAVEVGLTKNIVLAEKMSDLLREWQLNNENMATIAPSLVESVDQINNATKDQIDEINNVNGKNERNCEELSSELIAVSNAIKEHAETNQNNIKRVIDSVNNHTKLFSASLKSSKSKIREQFEVRKNLAVTKIKNIETTVGDGIKSVLLTAANIVDDIKLEESQLKEDIKNYVDTNTNLKSIAKNYNTSAKEKLSNWRSVLSNFHKNELKTYTSSG